MRQLSTILTEETHRLHSDHPMVFLAQLEPEDGPIERITNTREDIAFQFLVFRSVPFLINSIGEGSTDDPIRLQVTVGNADRYVNSLVEQFWVGRIYPRWIVTFWYVDQTQPNEVPFAANSGIFEVDSVAMDQAFATFEISPNHVSTTRNLGMRRFTPTGGFPLARVN